MKLTEIQKQLIQLLSKFIKDETSIVGIMLTLKMEEQQEQMIDYIIENKNKLDKEMIMTKMLDLIEN